VTWSWKLWRCVARAGLVDTRRRLDASREHFTADEPDAELAAAVRATSTARTRDKLTLNFALTHRRPSIIARQLVAFRQDGHDGVRTVVL